MIACDIHTCMAFTLTMVFTHWLSMRKLYARKCQFCRTEEQTVVWVELAVSCVPVWLNLYLYPSYGPWKSLKNPWIWFWQMGENPESSCSCCTSIFFISAPRLCPLGVYYFFVVDYVCLSQTLLLFCFSMESSHFLAISSPWQKLQNVVLRFLT